MRLDSVRELKAQLAAPPPAAPRLVSREASPTSGPARRAVAAARIQPTAALGVAPGGAGDFRLAVRVQHRDLLGSSRLEAIERAARGELDVRYLGRIAAQQAPAWHRRRQRPVLIGSSVGHYAITAGSVGAFVRRAGHDGPLLLSNNHVLADENRAQLGDDILQPGGADGGRRSRDTIGGLDCFVALEVDGVNEVDCALAALDDGVEADPRGLTGLGELAGTVTPEEAVEVAKVGRTTGLTVGEVSAFEVDNVVVDFDGGPLRFDGQIEVSGTPEAAFSQGGDSGSLIVSREGHQAVALLFAGSDQGGPQGLGVTYANPIDAVLQRLGVRLAT